MNIIKYKKIVLPKEIVSYFLWYVWNYNYPYIFFSGKENYVKESQFLRVRRIAFHTLIPFGIHKKKQSACSQVIFDLVTQQNREALKWSVKNLRAVECTWWQQDIWHMAVRQSFNERVTSELCHRFTQAFMKQAINRNNRKQHIWHQGWKNMCHIQRNIAHAFIWMCVCGRGQEERREGRRFKESQKRNKRRDCKVNIETERM